MIKYEIAYLRVKNTIILNKLLQKFYISMLKSAYKSTCPLVYATNLLIYMYLLFRRPYDKIGPIDSGIVFVK